MKPLEEMNSQMTSKGAYVLFLIVGVSYAQSE